MYRYARGLLARYGALCLLATTVVALGGCGGAPVPRTTASASTDTLVEFGRQGGIAGLSDRLTVRADGGLTVVRVRPAVNRTGQLAATELADLRQLLTDAHLAQVPTVQRGNGSDLFTYQVTYGDIGILAQDGAVVPPLLSVIAALSAIVDSYDS
jgi:hypothetical protein